MVSQVKPFSGQGYKLDGSPVLPPPAQDAEPEALLPDMDFAPSTDRCNGELTIRIALWAVGLLGTIAAVALIFISIVGVVSPISAVGWILFFLAIAIVSFAVLHIISV